MLVGMLLRVRSRCGIIQRPSFQLCTGKLLRPGRMVGRLLNGSVGQDFPHNLARYVFFFFFPFLDLACDFEGEFIFNLD